MVGSVDFGLGVEKLIQYVVRPDFYTQPYRTLLDAQVGYACLVGVHHCHVFKLGKVSLQLDHSMRVFSAECSIYIDKHLLADMLHLPCAPA